jgi:hypothetical protein
VRNPEVGFLDPDAPDERDFPTWDRAVKWVADLDVGQVLFVGTNWAHHVKTLETSISVSFDFVEQSNLSAYATSAQWAAALGDRSKRRPDMIVEKMRGQMTRQDIETLPAATVGRCVMAHILRSTLASGDSPELAAVRRQYLAHLEECLASDRDVAA